MGISCSILEKNSKTRRSPSDHSALIVVVSIFKLRMEFGFGGDFKAVGVADDGGHDNAIAFQSLFFQKEALFVWVVLWGAGGKPPRPHRGYLLEDKRTEPSSSEYGSVGANLGNFAPHHRRYVTSLFRIFKWWGVKLTLTENAHKMEAD